MASGTDFLLEINQRLTGASVVDELAKSEAAVTSAQKRYKDLESSSVQTAKGLEKVASQLEGVRGKMASALAAGDEKAFWKLAGAANELAKKQELLGQKAATVKAALASEQQVITGLVDKTLALKKAQESQKPVDHEEAAKGLKKLGGPLGKVGGAVEDLSEGWAMLESSLGTAGAAAAVGAAALAALAVAVVAVGAAMVAGAAAALKWAVGLADANRTQRLLVDGIAGSVEGGRQLDASIAKLQDRVPQTREELLAMAQDLAKTGLKGEALTTALEDAAVKAAELKWGPDFAKQINSLDGLAQRFQRNLAATFGGLNIEPLLDGLRRLVDLFDANTASGQALKVLFESIFQPLIDQGDVFTMIERGFLMMEIAALQFGIAIKEATAGTDWTPLWELLAIVGDVAWDTFKGTMIITGFLLTQAAMQASNLMDAFNWLRESATSLGQAITDGLFGVLKDGARLAFGTGWDLGNSIAEGAKKALGIASPSKVFEEIGGNTAAGFAGGVEDGTAGASSALERMVEPPAAGASGGSSGPAVNMAGATFVFNGVADAEQAVDMLAAKLAELVGGTSEQTGALA